MLCSVKLSKILVHGRLQIIALGFGDEDLAALVDDHIIDRPAADRSRNPLFDTNGQVRNLDGHSSQQGGDELAPRGLVCAIGVTERLQVDFDFLDDLLDDDKGVVINWTCCVCVLEMSWRDHTEHPLRVTRDNLSFANIIL